MTTKIQAGRGSVRWNTVCIPYLWHSPYYASYSYQLQLLRTFRPRDWASLRWSTVCVSYPKWSLEIFREGTVQVKIRRGAFRQNTICCLHPSSNLMREGIVRFVCLQRQSRMKTVCCSQMRYSPRHIGKLDQKLHTKFLWLNKKLSNLVYPMTLINYSLEKLHISSSVA